MEAAEIKEQMQSFQRLEDQVQAYHTLISDLLNQDSPLFRDVETYFLQNTHPEYTKPFKLGRLVNAGYTFHHRLIINAIPVGLEEEDIRFPAEEWDLGLSNVGNNYGVSLGLPLWAYEK
jgi:hypothetical protein